MSLIEISPDTFIATETYDRLILAADEAAHIKPEDCLIAVNWSDEELNEILSKNPRPVLDVTGLRDERLGLVLSSYVTDAAKAH